MRSHSTLDQSLAGANWLIAMVSRKRAAVISLWMLGADVTLSEVFKSKLPRFVQQRGDDHSFNVSLRARSQPPLRLLESTKCVC